MNKKEYVSPKLQTHLISLGDILAGSDVLINGADLFGEEN